MSDEPHCAACSTRSRVNLTLHQGRLWRPECLYTVAAMQIAGVARGPAEGTTGGVAGLRVVDRPRPRRLQRVK